jgi:transcription initiation factor TFIIIB Brf1 subunit/transcription initiation factor TFIIB
MYATWAWCLLLSVAGRRSDSESKYYASYLSDPYLTGRTNRVTIAPAAGKISIKERPHRTQNKIEIASQIEAKSFDKAQQILYNH